MRCACGLLISAIMFLGLPGQSAAKERDLGSVIADIGSYKQSGKLPKAYMWYKLRINDEVWNNVLTKVLIALMNAAGEKLLEKYSDLEAVAINENYDQKWINIYIIDSSKDDRGIIKRLHASGNAVSFPEKHLIIIDSKLFDRLMDGDVTYSAGISGDTESDNVVIKLKDCPPE
jgi:hypothetical protein